MGNENKTKIILCHDCGKKISFTKNKIKNGKFLIYKEEKEEYRIIKCNECYRKDKSLNLYQPCEVYSRIVGYYRPISEWNVAKKQEFKDRKEFKVKK